MTGRLLYADSTRRGHLFPGTQTHSTPTKSSARCTVARYFSAYSMRLSLAGSCWRRNPPFRSFGSSSVVLPNKQNENDNTWEREMLLLVSALLSQGVHLPTQSRQRLRLSTEASSSCDLVEITSICSIINPVPFAHICLGPQESVLSLQQFMKFTQMQHRGLLRIEAVER